MIYLFYCYYFTVISLQKKQWIKWTNSTEDSLPCLCIIRSGKTIAIYEGTLRDEARLKTAAGETCIVIVIKIVKCKSIIGLLKLENTAGFPSKISSTALTLKTNIVPNNNKKRKKYSAQQQKISCKAEKYISCTTSSAKTRVIAQFPIKYLMP